MTRRAARFTQADISRAAKAMRDAGCTVTGVRIDVDGTIEVLCAPAVERPAPVEVPTSLADWKRRRQHGARQA